MSQNISDCTCSPIVQECDNNSTVDKPKADAKPAPKKYFEENLCELLVNPYPQNSDDLPKKVDIDGALVEIIESDASEGTDDSDDLDEPLTLIESASTQSLLPDESDNHELPDNLFIATPSLLNSTATPAKEPTNHGPIQAQTLTQHNNPQQALKNTSELTEQESTLKEPLLPNQTESVQRSTSFLPASETTSAVNQVTLPHLHNGQSHSIHLPLQSHVRHSQIIQYLPLLQVPQTKETMSTYLANHKAWPKDNAFGTKNAPSSQSLFSKRMNNTTFTSTSRTPTAQAIESPLAHTTPRNPFLHDTAQANSLIQNAIHPQETGTATPSLIARAHEELPYIESTNEAMSVILQAAEDLKRNKKNAIPLKIDLANGDTLHCRLSLSKSFLTVYFSSTDQKLQTSLKNQWHWLRSEAAKMNLQLSNPYFF